MPPKPLMTPIQYAASDHATTLAAEIRSRHFVIEARTFHTSRDGITLVHTASLMSMMTIQAFPDNHFGLYINSDLLKPCPDEIFKAVNERFLDILLPCGLWRVERCGLSVGIRTLHGHLFPVNNPYQLWNFSVVNPDGIGHNPPHMTRRYFEPKPVPQRVGSIIPNKLAFVVAVDQQPSLEGAFDIDATSGILS